MRLQTKAITIVLLLLANVSLTSCELFWDLLEKPITPYLSVRSQDVILFEGETATCNASTQENATLVYTSADTNVATVDATGKITAVAPGTTQITVTAIGADDYYRTEIFGENTKTIDVLVENPLTFEAAVDNAWVAIACIGTPVVTPLEYRIYDGSTWSNWNDITLNNDIYLDKTGDKIQFRGDNATYATDYSNHAYFEIHDDCYVYGNIMSLIKSKEFTNCKELTADYTFYYLFGSTSPSCSQILSHPTKELLLPATKLTPHCYDHMFDICVDLTRAPELPATVLTKACYYGMFRDCNKLTSAPVLPATTLAESCYTSMFNNCDNLTSAPELPATTLAKDCYNDMFGNCDNLTTAPELPATTLAEGCYSNMFISCDKLTTAPALPATTLAESCYFTMFYDCDALTTAPALPATSLAENCYAGMFDDCDNLTTAPVLPATTLVKGCYLSMFYHCDKLNSVTCLATDITATDCTTYWLSNAGIAVTGTKTFYKDASMTAWPANSDNGVPTGWTVAAYVEP